MGSARCGVVIEAVGVSAGGGATRIGRRRFPRRATRGVGGGTRGALPSGEDGRRSFQHTNSDRTRWRTPHSGYHRLVGCPRPFFEGWYFRISLPETRENISLVYHVYDPDLPNSARRAAGAQVCAPGGKYIFRESPGVDAFEADAHDLALSMRGFGPDHETVEDDDDDDAYELPRDGRHDRGATNEPEPPGEREFFDVLRGGTRHRGRLVRGAEVNDPTVWPPETCAQTVAWDIAVRPVVGYGGDDDGSTQLSTAGWLSSLPVFEPHYQITMAHGLASGWIETDGARVTFEAAPAYSEKNWGGAGFPSKWFWVQCNAFPDRPGLSVTATGGNRGVVILPGVREEVAAVLVHDPGAGAVRGGFYPFVPAAGEGTDAAEVTWDVSPWGSWSVTAKTSTHEVRVICSVDSSDAGTVLRAPRDDSNAGMAPLCRESFKGRATVWMWELDPRTRARSRAVLDGVVSEAAAVETGGGPWYAPWKGRAEMREPLGSLAGLQVPVEDVARMLRPFVDIVPGL